MRITEQPGPYRDLETRSAGELLTLINEQDRLVAPAVGDCIAPLTDLVEAIVPRMERGGRLFYIGAGTSGRLGVLDASECPPTYGVPPGLVIGLIAGGDRALRDAVESAEDSEAQAWKDLEPYAPNTDDTLIGIAASGTTPYVIGGLQRAGEAGLLTGCVTCNPGAPVTEVCQHPIVAVVGPEIVTGSTRMKSGTAQKLILNMITTSVMIRLGRVKDNRMVDMKLSNAKLVDRGTKMIVESTGLPYEEARRRLLETGSVRHVIDGM
ncbi:N-acetylmuramic acid 6-phosphate etherase [Neolewinella xylanilytica]|uniref:N-acetylmuramic acid 6-phosphate etherase n=1 Tax=Neolewinella xylanilytica TaxID=1514080 RepID=A0A2S6IB82_9BACT|nr:N-acetylmuramic acid 6-phosphate etherase [Neolewinella xylanilytica]PPK88726.1 N-acetylmuramic acid 6-phosphate etherase [Neolewinella xylanilytica]